MLHFRPYVRGDTGHAFQHRATEHQETICRCVFACLCVCILVSEGIINRTLLLRICSLVREEADEEDILPSPRRNPGLLPWLRVDPGYYIHSTSLFSWSHILLL
jgi:hypothetical protein